MFTQLLERLNLQYGLDSEPLEITHACIVFEELYFPIKNVFQNLLQFANRII